MPGEKGTPMFMWYPPHSHLSGKNFTEKRLSEARQGEAEEGREAGRQGEAGELLYLNTGSEALCLNLCKEQTFVPLFLKAPAVL